MSGARAAFISAVVAILVAVVHAPVLWNDFVNLDDPDRIVENRALDVGSVGEALRTAFSPETNEAYPQPLTWLSFAADRAVFGTVAVGYHAENLLLHVVNAVLLLLLLHRCTGRPWAAGLAALLFGVHPLAVEPVAWATERNTLLAAAFGLASLHAYVAWAAARQKRWYLATIVAFTASLLSKPWLFPLPLVMLALDVWPLGRAGRTTADETHAQPESWKRLGLEKLPFLAISFAVGIAALWLTSVRPPDAPQVPPLALRVANAPVALVRYLGKLAVPRELAVLYPFPEHVPPAAALGAALAGVALTVVLVRLRRRAPSLLTGWAWFVLLAAPTMGVIHFGLWPAIADRFAYVPMMGIAFGLVFAVPASGWPAPARLAAGAGAFAIVAALVLVTRAQIPHWRDTISLLSHSSEVAPNDGEYDLNLGLALLEAGRLHEAERALLRAIAHLPGSAGPHYNLGHVYAAMGRTSDAAREFTRAVCIESGGRHERCRGLPVPGETARTGGR